MTEDDNKLFWSASFDATSWDRPACAFWMCMDCGMFHLGSVEGECRNCHPLPAADPEVA